MTTFAAKQTRSLVEDQDPSKKTKMSGREADSDCLPVTQDAAPAGRRGRRTCDHVAMVSEQPSSHSNRFGVGQRGHAGNGGLSGKAEDNGPRRTATHRSWTPQGVPPAILPHLRKPGGRHRAGQRAPGRCPPNPKTPVDSRVVLSVLERNWITAIGKSNPWRTRSLAALAIALAVPRGTTSIDLCAMLPSDLLRLWLPSAGCRWLKRWLAFRAYFVCGIEAELTPWAAVPPSSNGRPRQVGWGVTQTLHRAGAPAWRIRDLLATSWPGPPARGRA